MKLYTTLVIILFCCLSLSGCLDAINNEKSYSPVTLSGSLLESRRLDSDTTYQIIGNLIVPFGVRLTIPSGTTILCDYKSSARLIVYQGGELHINGTRNDPVVFTSSRTSKLELINKPGNPPKKGDWGGIFIHGDAPNNLGVNVTSDLYAVPHGGSIPIKSTSSGASFIKYLRIEYAGKEGYKKNPSPGLGPLPALGLYSVGANTTIEHVQAHLCAGDGFLFSGGTVNAKYLVSTGNTGNAFTFAHSWIGKGQFWLAVQDSTSKSAYYAYNNMLDPFNSRVRYGQVFYATEPRIYNATLVGHPKVKPTSSMASEDAIHLAYASKGYFQKHLIANFNRFSLSVDESGQSEFTGGQIILTNSAVSTGQEESDNYFAIVDNNARDIIFSTDFSSETISPNSENSLILPRFTSVDLSQPINGTIPDFRVVYNNIPKSILSSLTDPLKNPEDPPQRYDNEFTNFFNASADYPGAFGDNNWISGWTSWLTD